MLQTIRNYNIIWKFHRSIGGEITKDGDFVIFENNRYRSGFLYKTMVMSAIMSEGVKPSLSELERFEASIDDAELECIFFSENIFSYFPSSKIHVNK